MDPTPRIPAPEGNAGTVAGTVTGSVAGTVAGSVSARPYPIVLRLAGAPCLVVGAGPVAARKARDLVAAGAVVTVVAPEVGAGMRQLVAGTTGPGTLVVEARAYASPEASDYLLVVSATGDPGVDAEVTADALAGGSLVNRSDSTPGPGRHRAEAGTIQLPAVHRSGPVTVAVSTDGTGPALARWLRDRIARALGDALDGADATVLARLVEEVRDGLRATGTTGDAAAWDAALDEVAPMVAAGRVTEARDLLTARIVTRS